MFIENSENNCVFLFQYIYQERLLDIIDSHDDQQPLFLYIALQNPHYPLEVPEVYENM